MCRPAPSDRLARLVAVRKVGPGHHLLWFAPAAGAEVRFQPGQFTMVETPGRELLRRPFAYCDQRADGAVALLVADRGGGSRGIARLAVGRSLRFLGPLGRGFTLPGPADTPVVVGSGAGLAPFAALSRHCAAVGQRALVLAEGPAELVALLAWPNVEVRRITSKRRRASKRRGRTRGRGRDWGRDWVDVLSDLLPDVLAGLSRPRVYLGAAGAEVLRRRAAVAAAAAVPCEALIQRRMGCGVGACLGCVEYARPSDGGPPEYLPTCVEGPVFAAERLWPRPAEPRTGT